MMIYTFQFIENNKKHLVEIDAPNSLIARKKLARKYKQLKDLKIVNQHMALPNLDTQGILTDYSKYPNLLKD